MNTNKMNRSLLLASLTATLTIGAQAQPIPATLPMIVSQDALRQYALTMGVHGSRTVTSPSMDWSYKSAFTYTNLNGTSAENVLEQLFAANFSYRLSNPNDNVNGYSYVYDKDYNLLFYGSAQYTEASLGKGGSPHYELWMQEPPVLDGVDSAEILVLAEDGTTAQHIQVDVNANHQLLFPYWYAGAPNGILSVRFVGGGVATYNLWAPNETVPGATTDAASSFNINGHYIVNGGNCPQGSTCPTSVKIIETYNLPTVLLRMPAAGTVVIDVMGLVQANGQSTFEHPHSMTVTPEGKDSGYNVDLDTTQASNFAFGQGNVRIRFNWLNFGKPGTIYTGPTGKGVVAKPATSTPTPVVPHDPVAAK